MKILASMLLLLTFQSYADGPKIDPDNYNASLDFAQVTHVVATQRSNGSWCFNTSVRHNDEDWEHYADGWEVTDLEGNQLGFRLLGHPHVNEQPFTRAQCNIKIPAATTKVFVRAKCNKHGYGGEPVLVDLNTNSGSKYAVKQGN